MKTKIKTPILLIAFILSAIRCSVDAGGLPFPSNCSLCPPIEGIPEAPLEGIPEEELEIHRYTEEERQLLRQNLIGQYQSIHNNPTRFLDIRADGNILVIREERRDLYPYDIAFPFNEDPFLTIAEDRQREMRILFRPNNFEVIGLWGLEDGLDIFGDLLGYFIKLPGHDEL